MQWFTVNLVDPQTGQQMTTQERSTDQLSAEMKVQRRLAQDGEPLVVVSIYR